MMNVVTDVFGKEIASLKTLLVVAIVSLMGCYTRVGCIDDRLVLY